LNEAERRVVAYHEMGHALVAMALPGTDPVHKVSIIPRGIGALGYTIQRPTEDRFLMTQPELDDKLTVLLAGRAAEHLVLGALSTGAADDLAKATDIARSMVTRYGMNTELGHATYEAERPAFLGAPQVNPPASFSEATLGAIDSAVRGLVDAAFERACRLLEQHRSVLESGTAQLLIHETLDRPELEALRARLQPPADVVVASVARGKTAQAG
jgi:cell division protease FtsH